MFLKLFYVSLRTLLKLLSDNTINCFSIHSPFLSHLWNLLWQLWWKVDKKLLEPFVQYPSSNAWSLKFLDQSWWSSVQRVILLLLCSFLLNSCCLTVCEKQVVETGCVRFDEIDMRCVQTNCWYKLCLTYKTLTFLLRPAIATLKYFFPWNIASQVLSNEQTVFQLWGDIKSRALCEKKVYVTL